MEKESNKFSSTHEKIIKVLVVDDSAYIRKVVKQMLMRSPFIEVVGTASNGREALEVVEELNPDVITLDLIMPEMDGVSFVKEQMKRKPIPIVICSIASETGELALKALEYGAIDFVQKPTALATEMVFEISDDIINKVKSASLVNLSNLIKDKVEIESLDDKDLITKTISKKIVVIGVSTGGPQALKTLIPSLPSNFPIPIAIVLHMPVGYTELYAQKLNEISNLHVVEAQEDMEIVRGKVYIACAGKHLLFKKGENNKIFAHLDSHPFDSLHRPSVDVLFQSAAETYGEDVLAVIMTGMGSDGKNGCVWVKSKGGYVVTEDEKTCVVYGMPRSIVENGLSDKSVPLYDISKTIMELI